MPVELSRKRLTSDAIREGLFRRQTELKLKQEVEAREEIEAALAVARRNAVTNDSGGPAMGTDEVICGLEQRLAAERERRYAADAVFQRERVEASAAAEAEVKTARREAAAAAAARARDADAAGAAAVAATREMERLRACVVEAEAAAVSAQHDARRAVAVGQQAGEMAASAEQQV